MNEYLYDKEQICPVCKRKFIYTKVRNTQLKIIERRKDFYTKYEGVEPFFYDVVVCQNCGYAALESEFRNVSENMKNSILSKVTTNWVKRKFYGERKPEKALEAYELSLYCSQLKHDKDIVFAKTCLRISWIYQMLNDSTSENRFLKYSLDSYISAYSGLENFDEEIQLIYMIGELNKRLGNNDESLKWFNKVINHPEKNRYSMIVNLAREEWQSLKI